MPSKEERQFIIDQITRDLKSERPVMVKGTSIYHGCHHHHQAIMTWTGPDAALQGRSSFHSTGACATHIRHYRSKHSVNPTFRRQRACVLAPHPLLGAISNCVGCCLLHLCGLLPHADTGLCVVVVRTALGVGELLHQRTCKDQFHHSISTSSNAFPKHNNSARLQCHDEVMVT